MWWLVLAAAFGVEGELVPSYGAQRAYRVQRTDIQSPSHGPNAGRTIFREVLAGGIQCEPVDAAKRIEKCSFIDSKLTWAVLNSVEGRVETFELPMETQIEVAWTPTGTIKWIDVDGGSDAFVAAYSLGQQAMQPRNAIDLRPAAVRQRATAFEDWTAERFVEATSLPLPKKGDDRGAAWRLKEAPRVGRAYRPIASANVELTVSDRQPDSVRISWSGGFGESFLMGGNTATMIDTAVSGVSLFNPTTGQVVRGKTTWIRKSRADANDGVKVTVDVGPFEPGMSLEPRMPEQGD